MRDKLTKIVYHAEETLQLDLACWNWHFSNRLNLSWIWLHFICRHDVAQESR